VCRCQSVSTAPSGIVANWYPDPSRRFEVRWWDGSSWTPQAASGGRCYFDPESAGHPPAADLRLRWILPIGRDPLAIVAGYAGFGAFLIFLAPIALLFGILAAVSLRRHPGRLGWGRTIFGLTAGALGTLVLVALVAFPGS
jgi:hypothetical protein